MSKIKINHRKAGKSSEFRVPGPEMKEPAKVQVTNVRFTLLDGRVIEVGVEEARALCAELCKLFGLPEKEFVAGPVQVVPFYPPPTIVYPSPIIEPTPFPTFPPIWPQITCQITATGAEAITGNAVNS